MSDKKIADQARSIIRALNSAEDYGDHMPVAHPEVISRIYVLQKQITDSEGRQTVEDEA